ncbi:hypothetical protein D3C76_777010 [compost metagenome]
MAGEGTQALLNALLVADIGINRIEYAKLAAVLSRHKQPGHRHQAEQADRFQRDGLPPSVRAGDDNRRVLVPQLHIDRHHLIRRDQRMSAFLQLKEPAIVHARQRSLQFPGQPGFSEDEIQLAQHIPVVQQQFGLLANQRGELLQDDLNFAFLTQPRFAQIVVHRHDRFGLDEQRGPRSGLIVYNPAEMGAVFRFDRDNEAVAANRNQLILQHLRHRRGADHGIKLFPDPHLSAPQLAADAGQLGTSRIQHFCAFVDAAFNRIFQGLLFA